MYAAQRNITEIVNYLSLRALNLNQEDIEGMTILMHQLIIGNFRMSTRLILRGARVDYVNKHGKTALHLCIERKLMQ